MFSLLFPSKQDNVDMQQHEEDDECSWHSSSSEASDSQFMSEADHSFLALHAHQRVQHIGDGLFFQQQKIPGQVPSKMNDDISQVSLEYGSSVTSLDTNSIGLNSYVSGGNMTGDSSSGMSQLDLALKWRKSTMQKIQDKPSTNMTTVEEEVFHGSGSGTEEVPSEYQSFDQAFTKALDELPQDTAGSRKSSTAGMAGDSNNSSPILERALLKVQGPKLGLEAPIPPPPPKIIKKKYSGSQFQISPVESASRKAFSSDYPLSEANGHFDNKMATPKGNALLQNVKVGLGSERRIAREEKIVHENEFVNSPPSSNKPNQYNGSTVDWPSELQETNQQPKKILSSSPRSAFGTYSPPSSKTKLSKTKPFISTKSELTFSDVSNVSSKLNEMNQDRKENSDDTVVEVETETCFPRSSPCSMLTDPSGAKGDFLQRFADMKKRGEVEVKTFQAKCKTPGQCLSDTKEEVVTLLDPSLDPKESTMREGLFGFQRRTKQWMNQIWDPESEEWEELPSTIDFSTPDHSHRNVKDPDQTMPLTDDELSIEGVLKTAIVRAVLGQAPESPKSTKESDPTASPRVRNNPESNDSDSDGIEKSPVSTQSSLEYSMSSMSFIASLQVDEGFSLPKTIQNQSKNEEKSRSLKVTSPTRKEYNGKNTTLNTFDDQIHISCTIIQRYYRGFRDRYLVLAMLGVAKRKRWEPRTKSISVTKIHSKFRRDARKILRARHTASGDTTAVASMAVCVKHVCAEVIQVWWKKQVTILRKDRDNGFDAATIPSSWNTMSRAVAVPAFLGNHELAKNDNRPKSACSNDSKRTSTTSSSNNPEAIDCKYYGESHANMYEDDDENFITIDDDNYISSVSLLKKFHKGIFGRMIKLFRKRPTATKKKKKKRGMRKLKKLFKRGKKKEITPTKEVMLGDPEANARLPDPLSLYRPLEDTAPKDDSADFCTDGSPMFDFADFSKFDNVSEYDQLSLSEKDNFSLVAESFVSRQSASNESSPALTLTKQLSMPLTHLYEEGSEDCDLSCSDSDVYSTDDDEEEGEFNECDEDDDELDVISSADTSVSVPWDEQ